MGNQLIDYGEAPAQRIRCGLYLKGVEILCKWVARRSEMLFERAVIRNRGRVIELFIRTTIDTNLEQL